MKTFVTTLAFLLIGSTALACLPSYTLESTYTVTRPGFRQITAQIGGSRHESVRILIPIESKAVRMLAVDPNVVKFTRTIKSESGDRAYAEFYAVSSGKTVIKIMRPDGIVIEQAVVVEALPTPRGC